MPDSLPGSSDPLLDFDRLGSAGDVVAARRFAIDILKGAKAPDLTVQQSRLILAAACLQLGADALVEPSTEGLVSILVTLNSRRFARLQRGPMQFLHYVAAELEALEYDEFQSAMAVVIERVRAKLG